MRRLMMRILKQTKMLSVSVVCCALQLTMPPGAMACACCTEPGYRNVKTKSLDAYPSSQLRRIQFAKQADLFTDAGDAKDIKGIKNPSASYDLAVSQSNLSITFNFSDTTGRAATLTLPKPATYSVFEVDPRDNAKPDGFGPRLYKEWKFTGPAGGTGDFSPGVGGSQRLTLILQGRGLACPTADEFSAWTLVVSGPKGEFSLFGQLKASLPE
jgi:hypothetical protein